MSECKLDTTQECPNDDDMQLIDDIMQLAVEISTKSMIAIPTALVASYRIECEYPDIIKALAESKYVGGHDVDDFEIIGTSIGEVKQMCCCSDVEAFDILSAMFKHPHIGRAIRSMAMSRDAYVADVGDDVIDDDIE